MNKGDKIGDFTIQGLISQKGGFADVYEATCGKDASAIALKVLRPTQDPTTLHLFKNECDVLKTLLAEKNSGIVDFNASGSDGDTQFLAMEKLGKPLCDTLPAKPMVWEMATDYVVQVSEALVSVHRRGYVHHDVQLNNLLDAGGGRIKLCDFGIAYAAGEPKLCRPLGLTKNLSPEQLAMKRADPRSDQYNLGLVYHQLLTSREFVRHATEAPNLAKYGINPPQSCVDVLRKMLAKKAEDRYASIEEPLSILRKARGSFVMQRMTASGRSD